MPLHTVSVSGFEGPLDLLLELIEQEKLDITQVSLAQVTNQYLERIRKLASLPPEDLAQFLVVAARLILLKSKRLLPQFSLTSEEEDSIVSLEEQLKEYQTFRAQARLLQEQWCTSSRLFPRESYLGVTVAFYPPRGITGATLFQSIQSLMRSLPVLEFEREQAVDHVISLEERIRHIQARVTEAVVTSFHETAVKGARRADVIVSFLAILELVKQRIVDAEQEETFRDILIRKRVQT